MKVPQVQVIVEVAKVSPVHAETGSDDPGDAKRPDARGGADQFQSLPQKHDGQSAVKDQKIHNEQS